MVKCLTRCGSVLAFLLFVLAAHAADYVWVEAETPTRANVQTTAAVAPTPEWVSGGKWLNFTLGEADVEKKTPQDGLLFEYDFTVKTAGNYEVWERMGLESQRMPFQWRLDQGEWQQQTGKELTTDLMSLAHWIEVSWLKLGTAEFTAGQHTLQIRVPVAYVEKNGKKVARATNFTVDCFCLSKGAFYPNSKHQPDADWMQDIDKQAAAHTYLLTAPKQAGERATLALAGTWQVTRYDEQGVTDRIKPIATLPDAAACHWMGIAVPGDKNAKRPELAFCHRLFYRTRVQVPATMQGQSFFLRFPCNSMITSVLVNGVNCGGTTTQFANWDCDITKAVTAGATNEIWVGIKDTYYARADFNPTLFYLPQDFMHKQWSTELFDFPVANYRETGMLMAPSLIASGSSYTTDVFAIPSVKEKKLTLEVTLMNPSAQEAAVTVENSIVPLAGGKAEKVFAPVQATIPAGQELVIKPSESWANPKLWWPDDPQQYLVVTKVSIGGKVVDTLQTKFGFREWEWAGMNLKLNGIPWHGRGDTTEKPELVRKHNSNMVRLWGNPLQVPQAKLDEMDAVGMPVRWSGILDGMGGQYGNFRGGIASLGANWTKQSLAWVKENRNHPSIFMWSIENEMTFINARNWGHLNIWEPQVRKCAEAVMAFDPTRPLMVDGGRALGDKSLPIYGSHYEETDLRDYPDEAYTLEKMLSRKDWWQSWPIDRSKPIFLGEATYVRGNPPAFYAGISGEEAFVGRNEAKRGAGLLLQMQSEGYRWNDVNFWFCKDTSECDAEYASWTDIALFCRQWNWSFATGSKVPRTPRCFNDTRYPDPITAAWQLVVNNKVVDKGSKVCTVAPGTAESFDMTLNIPTVNQRTDAQLILTCTRNGKEVFRAVKAVAILLPDAAPKPKVPAGDILVLDPNGAVKARLTARNIPFTEVKSFEELPDRARLIIVGKDALTARQATDPKWLALAANDTRVIVLDQQHPLQKMALPADLEVMVKPLARSGPGMPADQNVKSFVGRIGFPENQRNPVFDGLGEQDFFTWGPDHILYRNPYLKATHGAVSLVQVDEELSCSALAECPVNDGLLLLCQLVVGEKLADNPVARRLFDNMVNYALNYQPVRKQTAAVVPEDSPEGRLLARGGLKYTTMPNVVDAISNPQYGVVVAMATPANLDALVAAQDKMKAYTKRGGYLMVWGLTADGLASFNKLVGVQHIIRPFDLERVTLPAKRDPLLAGITMRDVVLESNTAIFGWDAKRYPASDAFTTIVDFDEIGPFCSLPDSKAGDTASALARIGNYPRNIFNGYVSDDAWKLINYLTTKAPSMTLTFPQPEEITNFSIVLNAHYGKAQKVNLYFDDDPNPLALTTKPDNTRQDFEIAPSKVQKTLRIELADFDPITSPTTGIDNVWIKVTRSADWYRTVKPLMNIGALVKYPQGDGAIVLNNLRILDTEANPVNMQKKQAIVSSLLRNMGGIFSGTKSIVAGAGMDYTPLELGTKCNAFLTSDKGWYEKRDLSAFPKADVKLTGVNYHIRDFKTSPLPCTVMLTGPGAPKSATAQVTEIPLSKQADALFFLHTMKVTKAWKAPDKGDKTPPIVFTYVIHYADGSKVDVPIRYNDGIGHWISKNPVGMTNAAVAWAAPFEDNSGDHAVVYQYQWNNPKPAVEITSFDVVYDPVTKGGYGIPVLLAVTVANTAK